jgi:hypothetical protein
MADSKKRLWFLRVFTFTWNTISTVYKYVLVNLAFQAVLESPCTESWIPVPFLLGICNYVLRFLSGLSEVWINGLIFAAVVDWLNNFHFFNVLYKLLLCTVLKLRGDFFLELRKMLYSNSAIKEGGLGSCNPAKLWPSILQVPEQGFLRAVDAKALKVKGEARAEERGVFRFLIGLLDINIKTNQLSSNKEMWHMESITNLEGSKTEVLLCELTSQQVNLLVRVLRAWQDYMPSVGVIESTSRFLGLTVLKPMQLSDIVEHIKDGKEILIYDTSLGGKHVFVE